MGYVTKIKSYKEIKENDIDAIVNSLPYYLRGPFDEAKKQSWGWPCYCDISLPKGNELIISGAYNISGDKAEEFWKYIQIELDKKGYDTTIIYEKNNIEEVQLEPGFKRLIDAISDFSLKMSESFRDLVHALVEYELTLEERKMEENKNESND